MAALVASGCSKPASREEGLAPTATESADDLQELERLEQTERQNATTTPAAPILPYLTVTSDGSEVFAWNVTAFIPSAIVIELTENTSKYGYRWAAFNSSGAGDSFSPTAGDSFALFAVAPASAWTTPNGPCGGEDWRWMFQTHGRTGVIDEGHQAGRWVVVALAVRDGTVAISLGRSLGVGPGETPLPEKYLQASNSTEPAETIDATAFPPNPLGTQFETDVSPPQASLLWTIVRGTHLRDPESRVKDSTGVLCTEQAGPTPYTEGNTLDTDLLVLGATLAGGRSFTWTGVQAQDHDDLGKVGAFALTVPLLFEPRTAIV